MNTKFLLQDLTDQLAEQGKIKKKDAEEFLKEFFRVIEDALFQGDVVKINRFGTFKLTKVEPRKSVNVSTGQEIEIKEHYKITFNPEQGLKDMVNQPFSHLEPVQLDGSEEKSRLDDDRIDSDDINPTEEPEAFLNENSIFEKRTEPLLDQVAQQDPTEEKDQVKLSEKPEERTEEPIHELAQDSPEHFQSKPSNEIKPESMTSNDRETPDRRESENKRYADNKRYQETGKPKESPTETKPGNEIKRPIPAPQRTSRPTYQKPKPSIANVFWLILLLIIVSLGVWTFLSNREDKKEKQLKLNQIELFDSTVYEEDDAKAFETNVDDSLAVEAEIAAKMDSLKQADKGKPKAERVEVTPKSTVREEASQPTVKPATATKKAVSTVAKTATVASPKSINKDLPNTVTMQKGDRLTLLALKYYGNKVFWVYIYAANRQVIPDPNNVAIGTKIRIPAADASRTNPNDPACLEKARTLQTKIMTMKTN